MSKTSEKSPMSSETSSEKRRKERDHKDKKEKKRKDKKEKKSKKDKRSRTHGQPEVITGTSANSARAILQQNVGGGMSAYANVPSLPVTPDDWDGWTHSPHEKDYNMEYVWKHMRTGMFMKVFRKESFAVVATKAPPNSNTKSLIQVANKLLVPSDPAQAFEKKYPAMRGLSVPLLVTSERLTGVGNTSLTQNYLPKNMVSQQRLVQATTWIPDEMKRELCRMCPFPVGLYMTLFKKSLEEVSRTIDRFLFDTDGYADQPRELAQLKAGKELGADGQKIDEKELTELAFSYFRTIKGISEEPYRQPFSPDPYHPGEYVITVTYPVFGYPADTKEKPKVYSLENMHEEFEKELPEIVPDSTAREELTEDHKSKLLDVFIRDRMIKARYPFIPCDYSHVTKGPIADKAAKSDKERHFHNKVVQRGTLTQLVFGLKGVCSSKYYGSKAIGKPTFKIFMSRDLGDVNLVNEEYLNLADETLSLDYFLNPPKLGEVSHSSSSSGSGSSFGGDPFSMVTGYGALNQSSAASPFGASYSNRQIPNKSDIEKAIKSDDDSSSDESDSSDDSSSGDSGSGDDSESGSDNDTDNENKTDKTGTGAPPSPMDGLVDSDSEQKDPEDSERENGTASGGDDDDGNVDDDQDKRDPTAKEDEKEEEKEAQKKDEESDSTMEIDMNTENPDEEKESQSPPKAEQVQKDSRVPAKKKGREKTATKGIKSGGIQLKRKERGEKGSGELGGLESKRRK